MLEPSRLRSRRAIDRLVLVFVIACVGIALVRVARVTIAVSQTAQSYRRQAALDRLAGVDTTDSVLSRLRTNSVAVSWWGLRPVPYRVGGRYLDVASIHTPARSLGSVIGVIAEQERKKGIPFNRVIVPSNRTRLYGRPAGLLVTSADGTSNRTHWRSLAGDSGAFSDVPLVKKKYDPLLTREQEKALAAKTRLVKRTAAVYVGTSHSADSGTWVLLSRPSALGRDFLVVPIESSPVGAEW